MTEKQICLHAVVSGRVQGVLFRHSTYQKCTEWGLTGWVKNTADGKVEVMACGRIEAIELLKGWLFQGPPKAEVSGVEMHEEPFRILMNFKIRE